MLKLLVRVAVSLIFLSAVSTITLFAVPLEAATLSTDRTDYTPYDTAVISGLDFRANETVTLQVTHLSGDTPQGEPYDPWYVDADSHGDFVTYWLVPEDALEETLLVTAEGLGSGDVATATFTDRNSILVLTSALDDTLAPGYELEFSVNLYEACPGHTYAPLEARQVLFFLNEGSCGVNVSQEADDTVWTDPEGNALFVTTLPSVEGKYSIRAKFRGEPKPDSDDPANSACDPDKRINIAVANLCHEIVIDSSAGDYNPPVATCPGDTAIFVCDLADVCLPGFSCYDPDGNLTSCEVIGGYLDGDQVFFSPTGEGDHVLTLIATDVTGLADTCQTTVTVSLNSPPVCSLPGDATYFVCGDTTFSFPVSSTDPDMNLSGCTLVSGDGTLSGGVWTFTTAGAGVYKATFECIDDCGATCGGTVSITVQYNRPPVASCPWGAKCDTVIYVCNLDTICLSGFSCTDPDDNLISCQAIGGVYDGKELCFEPQVGDNWLRIAATDECGETDTCTVNVYVVLLQEPQVECPGDTSVFICEPDTLCFPLGALPDDASVTVFPPSAWFDPIQSTVCFYTNCTVEKDIMVVVESVCGVDTCAFTVDVTMNSAPLAILPPDSSLNACGLSEICVPAGISDIDNNIVAVVVSPSGGYYNPITGRVCFTPSSGGINTLVVKAIDACGAEDLDSMTVDVTLNSPPVITAPADTSVRLCAPEEICIPITITDADDSQFFVSVSPTGYYDSIDGEVCFTPSGSGVYQIVVTAADSCGAMDTAAINIIVEIDRPPVVVMPTDTSIFTCELEQLCFPVSVTDPDDNISIIRVIGEGEYMSGYVCFTPAATGSYTIIVEAVDECGNTAADTAVIEVISNTAPTVISADDFEIFQCDPEEICFDVDIIDPDANIQAVSTNLGYYDPAKDQVCFSPSGPGTYHIVTTVSDSCYASDVDTTTVTVTTGERAEIVCPDGPIDYAVCDPTMIYHPLEISPTDAAVTVSYGTYSAGILAFYADTGGTYIIEIIAEAACGSDTCQLVYNVTIGEYPHVVCPADTAVDLCGAGEICLPVEVYPPDAHVVTVPADIYSDGMICLSVDSSGHYEPVIKVITGCGMDSCSFALDVTFNAAPTIVSEGDSYLGCEPGETFVYDVDATDPEGDDITYSLIAGTGSIDALSGELGFTADTAGTYCFSVVAADYCSADTAEICITIAFNQAPVVVSAEDFEVQWCEPEEVCFPVSITDPDNNITSITVSPVGSYSNGYVCLAPGPGTYEIIITATDSCGAVDADTTIINFNLNSPPEVASAPDFDTLLCQIEEICFDVQISDVDDNIQIISTSMGSYDSQTGQICFTPDDPGVYQIVTTVSDSCYVSDIDTTVVTVNFGDTAQITCPEGPIDTLLCGPQEFCLPLEITPTDAAVSVSFGTYAEGTLCFMADTSGMYSIEVIADAECGSDTCDIKLNITIEEPAHITCPIDPANIYLCQPEQVCFPLEITPAGATVTTSYGAYAGGQLCFFADTSGMYVIQVIAETGCGTDTCYAYFEVHMGESAWIDCPASPIDTTLCEPGGICLPITIMPSGAEVTTSFGFYSSGELCFYADTSGTYVIDVIADADCGSDTCQVTFNVEIEEPPEIICPPDQTVFLCEPDTLCFPIEGIPDDATVRILPPPPLFWYDSATRNICFYADHSFTASIVITAETDCHIAGCTFTADVTVNTPPVVALPPDTALFDCSLNEICIPIDIWDDDGNIASIEVLPSGYYNETAKTVCFMPLEAGYHALTVRVTDSCGAEGVDSVGISIDINSPPVVTAAPDTSVITCLWGPICVPMTVFDADDNIVSISSSIGSYEEGQVCFTPTEEGTYTIIVTAMDACDAIGEDTTVVTVIAGEPFSLVCPGDSSVFICDPDTLCFAVGGIPTGAEVTVSPPSAWYDPGQGTVCFYTNCTVEKNLKIVVENECGVDSCMFTIDVTMNSKPLVFMPPDMEAALCEMGEICIPAGIGDVDNNIVSITASGGATYNPITNRVCFTPTSSGKYSIKVRALDACGAEDLDSTVVTVSMNEPPVVIAAPDFEAFQCELSEVCFPVDIFDVNDNIEIISVSPLGEFRPDSGIVCFVPSDTGIYELIITAADSCGLVAQDTTRIEVTLNSSPFVDAGPDTAIVTCHIKSQTFCLPVTIGDINDNIDSIYVEGAEYSDGFACLTIDEEGSYEIIITAVDCCGLRASDTLITEVILNKCPVVISSPDTTVFQCEFEEICFDVDVYDPENNVLNIASSIGTYDPSTGQVCFTPDSVGKHIVITAAVDACTQVGYDTTIVTVVMGEVAEIDCPVEPIKLVTCEPQTLCYDLDVTPETTQVSASYGTYADGQLCFQADTSGTYLIEVIAEARCGADTCMIEFWVEMGEPAQIVCPADTSVFHCNRADICLPVEVTPEYANVSVLPIGSYQDGNVCFFADTAGIYTLTVIAATDCGADTCEFNVTVAFNSPPTVDAGTDTSYFQCDLVEICRPVVLSDPDDNIDSVVVTPTGYCNTETGEICFTPTGRGTYCLTVTAYDGCGASGSDEVCITVTTGDAAVIDCPTGPFMERLCDPGQICVPLTVTPASAEVTVSFGIYADGQICFYADTAGSYEITAIASEICGADTCIVTVNVAFDEYAEIMCPDLPISASLCAPGTVSFPMPITPSSATLTILPIGTYDFPTKALSFFADTSGQYEITVIAETPCNADTCMVQVIVVINQVPELVCPGDFDTLVCLTEVSEICYHVDVIGSGVEVTVLPEGSYSGGMVCFPISGAGDYQTRVIAASSCGADTCEVTVSVFANLTPELTVPADTMIAWCEDDTGHICLDGIFAVDPEGDPVTITQVCGPGEFTPYRDDSGTVCFTPETTDSTYEFCFEVTDGCTLDTGMFSVTVYPSAICSVCVDVAIETDSCVVVGSSVPVNLVVETLDPIGGFDLLIAYDASVMSFQYAFKSDTIAGWEYFTHRLLQEDCGPGCPSMLVRLVGIADINNGPFHPPQDQLDPQGVLATMQMLVANNQNLGGLFLPVYFFWIDCGDNSFASPSGTQQYIESRIYNASGDLVWDEADDILFPEENRPFGFGAGDSCLVGDQISPIRCVYFHNGGICVKHPDSIDARGDVNLNGVAYEIADAVVFTNYFIYGLAAFTENVDGQIAATDVNADGFTLTIADLVYLVRVVIGDADRIPKVSPDRLELDLAVHDNGSSLAISADADCPLGAGLLVFRYDGVVPEIPTAGEMSERMHIAYSAADGELRVLIYSFEAGAAITGGLGELLSVGYRGSGSISLVDASFASFHGEVVKTNLDARLVPDQFMVSQNYPNPFNPMTSVDLSLPVACHWQMTIFNINGRVVRQFEGDAEPGIVTVVWNGRDDGGQSVASGIYIYKVEAGGFTATRKMTILK